MRFLSAFLLIALLATTGLSQAKQSPIRITPIGGTRVSLKPPAGFTPSPQFSGYWLESLSSSIIVTEFPGPYSEASSGLFNPSKLLERGLSLLNRQDVRVNGQAGVLLQVKQNAFGTEYLKWILIFGDEKETVLITATFPKEYESDLSEKMRTSILTATWDRERYISPTEGLSFTFSEKGELKIAKRIADSLTFTKSGVFPSKAIDDPLFIIGQAISKIEIDDFEGFAKSRIIQTTSVTDIEIEQSNKVIIDSLNGFEIVARGKDRESGQPMVIYQTMLFEGQSYYIMQGLIGGKQRQTYLTVFKEMAGSFKRKKF